MTIIIVLENTTKRFISSHKYFTENETLGYYTIGEEELASLPQDVLDSMIQISAPQTVYIFVAGTA